MASSSATKSGALRSDNGNKNKSKKRKADEPEEPKDPGDWEAKDALQAVTDLTQIPNQYVKIVWYCDLATRPQPLLRLVSPVLCWAQTLDLQDNQIFQFC